METDQVNKLWHVGIFHPPFHWRETDDKVAVGDENNTRFVSTDEKMSNPQIGTPNKQTNKQDKKASSW